MDDPEFAEAHRRSRRRWARRDRVHRLLGSLWVKVFASVLTGFVVLWAFIGVAVWVNQHLGDTACFIYLIVGISAIVATCVAVLKALIE
jgi:uncharacterized membrane protein